MRSHVCRDRVAYSEEGSDSREQYDDDERRLATLGRRGAEGGRSEAW
jgi:hypothetical protein